MKIEVRPIEKKKWHGKSGKESYTRTRKIQALVDENYKYQTGLTSDDLSWLKERNFDGDLSDNYNPKAPHPFWDSKVAVVELKNSTQIYDTNLPLDRIRIAIMRASNRVANSMKEYTEGLFDEATHVIYDEKEELEVLASRIELKESAIVKVRDISEEKKINIVKILSGKNLTGSKPSTVKVHLSKLIDTDAKAVHRQLERDEDSIVVEALVLNCVASNILLKKGHKYYYYNDFIADSVEGLVDYFKNEENQQLRFTLVAKLEEK